MQPIHELLSRISWDEAFGKGEFEIAYVERGQDHLEKVSLENVEPLTQPLFHVVHLARRAKILIRKGKLLFLYVLGSDKLYHDIPFHRVREVYKNKELIWKRSNPEEWESVLCFTIECIETMGVLEKTK